MNKKLAIKGHSTRGQEVIEILEMMGGINHFHMDGFTEEYIYYICGENNQIHSAICPTNQIVFTIEEFLEKYPYKIGDKVDYIKYDDEEFSVYEIKGMVWTGTTIEYTLDSFGFTCLTKDIRLHKENNMNKKFKSLNVETYLKVWDETENGLEVCVAEGYEMIEKDGQFYIVKQKTKYPRDFDECCEVLNTHLSNVTRPIGWKENLISKFQELIICRDAYRKIAGEQMGLGKPWEPDWTKANEKKYCIVNTEGNITKWVQKTTNKILAFPTEEMRDAFYENFKDLIEQCKELL
jgi:hypothetical protein